LTTQDFLSDLWTRYGLVHRNEAIFLSHNAEPTPQASVTQTPSQSDNAQSIGSSQNGFRAPLQIIQISPPMYPPKYRERNKMNPLDKEQQNIAEERVASEDPRMNKTGNHIPYAERLENMDIQTPRLNVNAIVGIVGILGAVVAIVWLSRGRKG
jgi:hypothetical protein